MQGALFVDAGSCRPRSSRDARLKLVIVDDCRKASFIFDSADARMSSGFQHHLAVALGPFRADIAEALLKAEFDRTELFRFGASTNF